MKTAVIGSRRFNDYALLQQTLDTYTISQIISGGAKGADTLAEQYAKEKVFLPRFSYLTIISLVKVRHLSAIRI
jgi:hypothetical protein